MWSSDDPHEEQRILIRMMDPRGHYPATTFARADTLYVGTESAVYSAVRLGAEDYEDMPEVGWAHVPEIRLWGALLLAVPNLYGGTDIYPGDFITVHPADLPSWDLTDLDCQTAIEQAARSKRQWRGDGTDRDFQLHIYRGEHRAVQRVFTALGRRTPVLTRGIACLLKARMLWKHQFFGEEATISTYIAMEAALQVIRAYLERERGRAVSFDDAYAFIGQSVERGDGLQSYLRLCWENRVRVLHPTNRHGEEVLPFLFADDFLETFEAVVALYRFIFLGDTSGVFEAVVAEPHDSPPANRE